MSEAIEDEDEIEAGGKPNGHDEQVSEEDIRALLATARREKAQLGTQLEQERTARTRAETQAHTATSGRFDAEEAGVKHRIEAADAAALGMRAKYAEALAEGRFEDVAQIQDEMTELRAKQGQDKQYQAWLGAEKERLTRAPVQQEQGLNLANYTPGQRKWIKANPDFMTDIKLRQKTEAMHAMAMADGIEVDSDEYFEVINQALPKKKPAAQAEDDDVDEEPPPRRRAAQSTDMPVTRRTDASGQPARNRSVKLTPEQREVADFTMPDLPVQGYMRDGNWVPSRYEKYLINDAKLKARG